MDIVLDFGNVLINLDFLKTEKLLVNYLKSDVNPQFYTEKAATFFYAYETGELSTAEFLQELRQHCHSKVTDQELLDAWNALLLDIPKHRLDFLEMLRQDGHRVFLLSNTNAAHIEYVLQYLQSTYGIKDFETRYFDQVFYSHVMKLRKPDTAIYDAVAEAVGLHEDMIFYDDNAQNVAGAREAGWRATLHNPKQDIVEVVQTYLRSKKN